MAMNIARIYGLQRARRRSQQREDEAKDCRQKLRQNAYSQSVNQNQSSQSSSENRCIVFDGKEYDVSHVKSIASGLSIDRHDVVLITDDDERHIIGSFDNAEMANWLFDDITTYLTEAKNDKNGVPVNDRQYTQDKPFDVDNHIKLYRQGIKRGLTSFVCSSSRELPNIDYGEQRDRCASYDDGFC